VAVAPGRLRALAVCGLAALTLGPPPAAAQAPTPVPTTISFLRFSTESLTRVSGPFEVQIVFGVGIEQLTGFEKTDITVTNGTVTGDLVPLEPISLSASFKATITPDPGADGEMVSVRVAENVAMTQADNRPNAASNTLSWTVDFTPPTVTSIDGPDGFQTTLFVVTVNFSEEIAPNSLNASDLTVARGRVQGAPVLATDARSAAFTIFPLADDGPLTVDIAAGRFEDDAGNANAAAAPQLSVLVDIAAPTVELTLGDGVTAPVNGAFGIDIAFSEDVTGFALDDLMVTNGTASALMGTGAAYTAMIAPDGTGDGTVTVDLAMNRVLDRANRGNEVATPLSVAVDRTAPTPTLALDSGVTEPVGGVFDITVTFDEDVTGFDAADLGTTLTVDNGLPGGSGTGGICFPERKKKYRNT